MLAPGVASFPSFAPLCTIPHKPCKFPRTLCSIPLWIPHTSWSTADTSSRTKRRLRQPKANLALPMRRTPSKDSYKLHIASRTPDDPSCNSRHKLYRPRRKLGIFPRRPCRPCLQQRPDWTKQACRRQVTQPQAPFRHDGSKRQYSYEQFPNLSNRE